MACLERKLRDTGMLRVKRERSEQNVNGQSEHWALLVGARSELHLLKQASRMRGPPAGSIAPTVFRAACCWLELQLRLSWD